MQDTGLSQATIAYKVSLAGEPLDVDGGLISVSEKKQAIALLQGTANPAPTLYEVEFYFEEGAILEGNSTQGYGYICPQGVLNITPSGTLILTNATPSINLEVASSSPWNLSGAVPSFISLSKSTGDAKGDNIVADKTSTEGQGYLMFVNSTGQNTEIYVVNVAVYEWILSGGIWKNLGFWDNTSIWQF